MEIWQKTLGPEHLIFATGERGDAVLAERTKNGIPLPQGTWDRIAEAVAPLGVTMPEVG